MAKEKQIVRKARQGKPVRQVAAVPFRLRADGQPEILLVTSNTTQRFIVPKGWPMKGKTGRKAAKIEAMEEAGVSGTIRKEPIGAYGYWKRLSDRFAWVNVTVYVLEVDAQLDDWEEAGSRQRAWLTPSQAALLIDEPELAALVRTLGTAE